MFRRILASTALLALMAIGPEAGLAKPPDLPSLEAPKSDPVRAELIAETQTLVPGQSATVAVHLIQDPGWHTYWLNSGDSGYATEVTWKLPDGYTVGELQWPSPESFEEGDLITYGYSKHAVLMAQIQVPADAPLGERVSIGADVSWLMCKTLCIPGDAQVNIELTVASSHQPAPAASLERLAAARARLPRSLAEHSGLEVDAAIDLSAVPPGQSAHLGLRVRGLENPGTVAWTFFPDYLEPVFPGHTSSTVDGNDLLIGMPFEIDEASEPGQVLAWGGVLELESAGVSRFVQLEFPLRIASPSDAVDAQASDLFGPLFGLVESTGLLQTAMPAAATGSLWKYLLLAVVGGLILNVMPCVLPVLSLKIMGFVQHANEDRGMVFRLGLVFSLGVLASFLALALVVVGLQTAGDQLGWGFQFQNPAFVVVMAAVVFAFGLSLFGVFEIVLPVGMGGGGGRGGAYTESFFNGILATALATPCTAPFLGTALGFAFTQSAVTILAIFLTIGLGLSLPYLLLSMNPGWLKIVPKPGPWMEQFKQVMGFLLMATLVWLLWVLGKQIGADGVIWTLAFLLTLGFGLWLYGSTVSMVSSNVRRVVMMLVLVGLTVGGWVGFLTEPLSDEYLANLGTASAGHVQGGLAWEPFTIDGLETAVADGNTVFIDFTAAWCLTCKTNEKTILSANEVVEKLRELNVVTLVGDWTRRDPVITSVLRKFGRSGVPFYAIFHSGRLDDPIVLPEVITKGMVLEALENAGPSRGSGRQAARVDEESPRG